MHPKAEIIETIDLNKYCLFKFRSKYYWVKNEIIEFKYRF